MPGSDCSLCRAQPRGAWGAGKGKRLTATQKYCGSAAAAGTPGGSASGLSAAGAGSPACCCSPSPASMPAGLAPRASGRDRVGLG
jgi:hypothetical protein